MNRKALIVLSCGALIVCIAMGVRQAFGIFLPEVGAHLHTGRQVFGFAMALQNLLFGLLSPFIGAAADRHGSGRVIVACTLIYAAGMALTTLSTGPWELYVYLGLLVGIGLSGTTYVVVLGAVGRAVSERHRSTAFGITTALGSFGMFAFVPGAQALVSNFGWSEAMIWLAVMVGAIALLAAGVSGRAEASQVAGETLGSALASARKHSGYWLLNTGFFVCGFHVAFIAVHLPAYLQDNHISADVSANALALIGFFNIFGSFMFGHLGGRYRKKYLLSGIYIARAVVISLFLLAPLSNATALMFSAAIGFLWLATVPLTSGIVAQIFGLRYLSTLYGMVFLSHQVGSFFGAWLGGYAYDLTGSYHAVWVAAVILGVAAAALHWPIRDTSLIHTVTVRPQTVG